MWDEALDRAEERLFRNGHVDVQAGDDLAVEARAALRLHPHVALERHDRHRLGRRRMRARGDDGVPVLRRSLRDLAPQRAQLRLDLVRRLAHRRRDLDERFEQLRQDPFRRFTEHARPAVARRQKRLRVDKHELFLHPE